MSQYPPDPRRDPAQQPTTAFGTDPYAAPPPQQRGRRQQPNPFGTQGNEQFGITGMVMGLLGGVLLIVCFTALDWFSTDTPDGTVTRSFGEVSDFLDNGNGTGFATAYFHWFAWTFMVVSVACAVGSSFPSPALRALRALGVVVAFAAAGLSFLAIQISDQQGYTEFLKEARVGFYLAVVGFVLIGIGAAIGPRKV